MQKYFCGYLFTEKNMLSTFKQVVVKINFFKKNGRYNIKIPADPSSHSTLDQEGLA